MSAPTGFRYRSAGAAVALFGVFVVTASLPAVAARADDDSRGEAEYPEEALPSAPVEVDGAVLFRVRGASAFPAEERAAAIALRIEALAADAGVPSEAVETTEAAGGTRIFAGSHSHLMIVQEADAKLESLDRAALAVIIVGRIRGAVTEYRAARTPEALMRSATFAGAATATFGALLALVFWGSRRLQVALERRYRERVPKLGIQSFEIVRAERVWRAAHQVLNWARSVAILVLGFVYLRYVLGLFPWTRGIANQQLGFVLDPLATMGRGIASEIPALVFLAVLFLVTRYLLKLLYLFLGAVGRGEVTLAGFDRLWAEPTYKLVRTGTIAFALVVAYPYVPGSSSEAFKGISIFLGLVFSLGSTSAIANLIAGYLITYRRAFKIGDRVKIGDLKGDVTEMRLQVTHLRTVKNEEVIVPNSSILNNEVVNFSSLAGRDGLILHTTIHIGYGVPWRQVEAMLILAAERTPGLMKGHTPFIRQQALGEFAVTYELNVYSDNAQAMDALYTELHRNILDVFNEYGVQIMTPAYEGDPEQRKVISKEHWFSAPAKSSG